MKKDEQKDAAKATWIQLSKDKKKGIVYEIGLPKDYPPPPPQPQQPFPGDQA